MKIATILFFSISFLTSTYAAPAEPLNVSPDVEPTGYTANQANIFDKRDDLTVSFPASALLPRSAGLYWGPVKIGNLKLSLTNPHVGYAGPKFPNANHVNFHVDKSAPRNKWTAVVNAHIVKYHKAKDQCLYVWDSVSDKVVFDSCFDNFPEAIEKAVVAIKNSVDTLLKNANFIASFAIIVALGVALIAALTSLGAVAVA